MHFQHIDACFAYENLFELNTSHRPIAVQPITERIIHSLTTCPLIGRRSIVVASPRFQELDILQSPYVKRLHAIANPLRCYDLREDEDVDYRGEVLTYDGIVILRTSDMPFDFPRLWSRHIEPLRTPTLYLSTSPIAGFVDINIFATDAWQQIAEQPPRLDNTLLQSDAALPTQSTPQTPSQPAVTPNVTLESTEKNLVTFKEQILALLTSGEKPTAELLKTIEGDDNAIKNELGRLVRSREIVRVRHGVYVLPE